MKQQKSKAGKILESLKGKSRAAKILESLQKKNLSESFSKADEKKYSETVLEWMRKWNTWYGTNLNANIKYPESELGLIPKIKKIISNKHYIYWDDINDKLEIRLEWKDLSEDLIEVPKMLLDIVKLIYSNTDQLEYFIIYGDFRSKSIKSSMWLINEDSKEGILDKFVPDFKTLKKGGKTVSGSFSKSDENNYYKEMTKTLEEWSEISKEVETRFYSGAEELPGIDLVKKLVRNSNLNAGIFFNDHKNYYRLRINLDDLNERGKDFKDVAKLILDSTKLFAERADREFKVVSFTFYAKGGDKSLILRNLESLAKHPLDGIAIGKKS